MTIGFPSGPDSLDPFSYRSARAALIIETFVSLPLLRRDANQRILRPALAASLPTVVDGRVLWTLRPEARFGDGRLLSSADVKRTIEALQIGSQKGRLRDAVDGIIQVTTKGPQVFELTYEKPGYLDIERFGTTFVVLPKSATMANAPAENLAFSSGPFRIASSDAYKTKLTRDERWWGDKCPDLAGSFDLDTIVLRYVADQGTLPLLLNEGAIQLAPLSVAQSQALQGKIAKAKSFETASFSFLGWNCQQGLAKDPRVRHVLGRLIPRKRVASQSKALTVHPGVFAPTRVEKHSPLVTDDELRSAGFADVDGDGRLEFRGKPTKIRVLAPLGKIPWAESTLNAWRDVAAQRGLIVEIERLPVPLLLQRLEARTFDAFALIWRVRPQEPSFSELFHSSQAGKNGRNFMGVKDATLDRLLDRLEATFDRENRLEIRQELARHLETLEPITPLYRHRAFLGIRSDQVSCTIGSRGVDWTSLHVRNK